MTETARDAWNDVGERFVSWGRHVADRYKEGGPEGSADQARRKLEQAAHDVMEELTRGFNAVDGTLRDDTAKKDLKDAVSAIGGAITATVNEATEAVRSRSSAGDQPPTDQPPTDQPGEGTDTTPEHQAMPPAGRGVATRRPSGQRRRDGGT